MASVVFPIQAMQMGSLEVRGADPAQMHQPETHPEDVLTSEEKMAGERPQNIMILMNCKKNCKQVLSVDLPGPQIPSHPVTICVVQVITYKYITCNKI